VVIRDWIQVRKDQHSKCRNSAFRESTTATRILRIGRSDSGQIQVGLEPMAEVKQGNSDYVVLSHVWGDVDITCKTTRCNFSQYEQSRIEFDSLPPPPTFTEAILLTLDINIQYI
jgi:hypothetical protein